MGEDHINDWTSLICRAEGLAVFWGIRRQGEAVWIRQGELGSQGDISLEHYPYEPEAEELYKHALRKRRLLGFREARPEDLLLGTLPDNLMQGSGKGLIPAAAPIRWSLSERHDRLWPVYRPDRHVNPQRLPDPRRLEQCARSLKRVLGEVLPAKEALGAADALIKAQAGLEHFRTSTGPRPALSLIEAALALRLDAGPWAASYLVAVQGVVNTLRAALLAWQSERFMVLNRSGLPLGVFPDRLAACLVLRQAVQQSEYPKTARAWMREQISAQGDQGRLLLAFVSDDPELIENEAGHWLELAGPSGGLSASAYLLWPLLRDAGQLQRMSEHFLRLTAKVSDRDSANDSGCQVVRDAISAWLEDSLYWLLDRQPSGCADTLAQLVRHGRGSLRRRAAKALSILRGPEAISSMAGLLDSHEPALMQAGLAADPARAIAPLLATWQAKPQSGQILALLKAFGTAYPEQLIEADPGLRQSLNLPSLADSAQLPDPFAPTAPGSGTGSRLPGWWRFESLPAPILRATGQALPPIARNLLAELLARSSPAHPAADLDQASRVCSPESMARFAWRGFELWLAYGAASRERWLMTSLAHLGGEAELSALGERLERMPDHKALNQNAGLSHALAGLEVLEVRARAGSKAAAQALLRLCKSHHPPLKAAAVNVLTRL